MYRTISTQLWTDPAVKQLDAATKLLFVYLITNPHTHLSGIYYLPEETILKETGLKKISYRYGIDKLSKLGKVYLDETTETIFVTNMFRHQGRGTKNNIAAANHLRTLHHSSLITHFLSHYPSVVPLMDGYPIDTPSNISAPVPDPVSSSVPDSGQNLRSKTETEEFEQFWLAYPRKVGKLDAWRMWQKVPSRPPLSDVLEAIAQARTSPQWQKEQGQFIPHPATWLHDGRWADEPCEMKGVPNGSSIPPFPGPNDPIGRGLWRQAWGDPANPRARG